MSESLPYEFENYQPGAVEFIKALRPGDRIERDDRERAQTVVIVDRTGEYVPKGMNHWTHTTSALLKGQGDSYFRLCVLNSGTSLRVYRQTDDRWDYGTDSQGQPESFTVTSRLGRPTPGEVIGRIERGDRLLDDLHPWRYSKVVDPSDALGDIVVKPWQPNPEYVPYPALEPTRYAIRPDEVVGARWASTDDADQFSI